MPTNIAPQLSNAVAYGLVEGQVVDDEVEETARDQDTIPLEFDKKLFKSTHMSGKSDKRVLIPFDRDQGDNHTYRVDSKLVGHFAIARGAKNVHGKDAKLVLRRLYRNDRSSSDGRKITEDLSKDLSEFLLAKNRKLVYERPHTQSTLGKRVAAFIAAFKNSLEQMRWKKILTSQIRF